MFLLNLPVNTREQAAIERRRREEKERLSRIFNVKYRTIGVDYLEINSDQCWHWIAFRSIRRHSMSKWRNEHRWKNSNNNARMPSVMRKRFVHNWERFISRSTNDSAWFEMDLPWPGENPRRASTRPRTEHLPSFASTTGECARMGFEWSESMEISTTSANQWPWSASWPLFWPNIRRWRSSSTVKEKSSTRTDEKCSSSASNESVDQRIYVYADLIQNQAKMAKEEQERFTNRLHDCQQMKLFEESVKFEEMENECRRAIDIASRDYNEILVSSELAITRRRRGAFSCLRQARETRMRAHEWKRRQTEEQLAELANTCFSDMLTENVPENQLEGRRRRIIVDRWKGMTKDQLDEIHRVQKAQIDERRVRISFYRAIRFTYLIVIHRKWSVNRNNLTMLGESMPMQSPNKEHYSNSKQK